jgi:DNA-binding winged helix-turn-helix (wHTH) protein/tetratricopeptide (TPR) repeat protein
MPVLSPTSDIFRFGLFEVDCAREVLARNGVRVRIQNQPFRVLVLLLERRGEIVTREELKEALWPDGTHVDFDGSLNVILKRLRAAIDDDSDNPRFIETVPRRGYRFIAPVTVTTGAAHAAAVETAAGASVPSEPAVQQPAGVRGAKVPRWSLLAAAALLLAGAASVAAHHYSVKKNIQVSAPAEQIVAPVALRPSLAVLGFRNLSGRPEDAWLSAAFAEMLATELSGDGQLRLAAGQDVENLRSASPWLQAGSLDRETTARIGSALNSEWLVLGSYTVLAGSQPASLRLDVRLQKAATGQIVSEFSETGTERGIFQLVSQAGDRLRDHLGLAHMEDRDVASVLSALPLDPDAARFYALGVGKLRQYDPLAARDLLEQATRVDPKFSLAHAMLAQAWSQLGYGDKRKGEAKLALDLSADLPQQLRMIVQGEYDASTGRLEDLASIDRALFELYPDNVDYGLNLAGAEKENGHASEARDVLMRLRRLPGPAAEDPRIDLAEAAVSGNRERAIALIRRAEEKATAQGKQVLWAQARRDECMQLLYGDHPEQGPAACYDAFRMYLAVGNRAGAADALRLLGDGEGTQGHFAFAIANYRRALAYTRDLGEHEKTGAILNNMAIVLTNQGNLDEAERMYREAKSHFQAAGNLANMSTALVNLGDIAYLRGKLEAAEKLYRQGLDEESKLDPSQPGYVLSRLADLELAEGRVHEAQLDATAAKEVLEKEKGSYQYYTAAMNELGDALKAQGRLSEARAMFDEALAIRRRMGEMGLVAEEQAEIANLLLDQKSPEQAEPLLRDALVEFEKESASPAAASAYILLSRALLEEGKLAEAEQMAKRGSSLGSSSPDPALRLPAAIQSARVEAAAAFAHESIGNGTALALQKLRSTAATAKELGYFELECEARLALGQMSLSLSQAAGKTLLATLADEARTKGYMLVAQKAEQASKSSGVRVASNQ